MKPVNLLPFILTIVLLLTLPVTIYGSETTTETDISDTDVAPTRGIDELYGFTFTLEDDTYTLPFPIKALLDRGWNFSSESADTMLSPNEYSWNQDLVNENLSLRVKLKNFSENSLTYENADVVSITIYQAWNVDDQVAFEFPGGITNGTLISEVIAFFGEPNQLSNYSLSYGHDGYSGLTIEIKTNDRNEAVAGSFTYTKTFVPANPDDIDGLNVKDIADVPDYMPPTELGDKLANKVVSLDGKLMRLPVPLSELLTDGWTVDYVYGYNEATTLDPSANVSVFLRKGNAILESSVTNFSQTEKVPLESCLLTNMRERRSDPYADQSNILLAQEIGIGSNRRSVVLLYLDLKPDVSVYGSQETYSIRFREGNTKVTVQDDQVTEIYVSSGW